MGDTLRKYDTNKRETSRVNLAVWKLIIQTFEQAFHNLACQMKQDENEYIILSSDEKIPLTFKP